MLPEIRHATFIHAAPQRVFETLTTAEGWNRWFTTGASLELKPGGEFIFRWKDWGPNHVNAEDKARVLEIVPNEKFVFVWNMHEGGTTVTFTLEPRADGTVLRIADEGYKTPEYFMECATGWGEALTLLKVYLEHGVTYGDAP